MLYEVISNKQVCGKVNGESLTESDIISRGGDVVSLLASGHIKEVSKTPKATEKPKAEEVVKEEVQTPQAFVLNTENHEGDK